MNPRRVVHELIQGWIARIDLRHAGLGSPEPGSLRVSDAVALVKRDQATIIEIGANTGTHTALFAAAMPNATIYACEPDERAWRQLQDVCVRFPNVRLMKVAVSDSDGVADFYCSSGKHPNREDADWNQSGSLCQPTGHLEQYKWCTFTESAKVQTRSLDSITAELGIDTIDFIWMDVQGAERHVLKGATKTLALTRYLYTEYSDVELYAGQPSLKEILGLANGFQVSRRFPGDALLKNRQLVSGN